MEPVQSKQAEPIQLNLPPLTALVLVGGTLAGLAIFAVVLLSSDSVDRPAMLSAVAGGFHPRR